MVDPASETIAYYDAHAAEFAGETAEADLSPLRQKFLSLVPPGGRILDAGCGVGRDTLAFAKLGFEVVAFDASKEMVRLAQAKVKDSAAVHLMQFEEIVWRQEFDGVWACASLLHVSRLVFPQVVLKLADSLKRSGVWYMSFKVGHSERVEKGRLFVDHTESTLRTALRPLPLEVSNTWISYDVRVGREHERWLNVLGTKANLG